MSQEEKDIQQNPFQEEDSGRTYYLQIEKVQNNERCDLETN